MGGEPSAVGSPPEGKVIENTVKPFPEFINDVERFIMGFVTGSGGRKT